MSSADKLQLDNIAVNNFREYLQIPSVQPNVDYEPCVTFLENQAKSLDLPIKVYRVDEKKPIIIITWVGSDPSLPSILLNSHMDVVPCYTEKWTYPPFSAHMDEKGNIYARGSQDMKCVGIQYLEAIRRVKTSGITCKRTIHVSFVPDEEIGGTLGMKKFVPTNNFKALNVGFALDEGVACPNDNFYLFYGERSIWHIWVYCTGQPGHGSMLMDNTAGEKLRKVIDQFMDFRAVERAKLNDPNVKLGDVTSINITQLRGGLQTNIIPSELSVGFDIRIAPSVNHAEFEATIQKWCENAGEGVTHSYIERNQEVANTKLDDSNHFWLAFKQTCDDLSLNLETGIFPGGTDSRYVRAVGIPAIGFSPMNNTPILLHDNDEYLNKDIFLKGIEIYTKIIPAVANV